MSNYRKTMSDALQEMYSLDESVIDKVKEIASKKSAKKIDGVMVDSFTASAISQIYDKVNDANKKKMEKLPITKLANLAFKMMQKNEFVPEEADLDEALSSKDQKAIEDYVSKFMSKMTPDLKAKMEKDPKAAAAVLAKMAMNTEDLDEADDFKPHMMYDPKTGKGYKADTMDDHLRMKKMGYTHDAPKTEEVEESAASDARRAMRRDKDFSRKDSADDDNDATDDDVKAASKNIIMQMRKAVSMRGNFKVEFGDKKKVKIPAKIAQAVQAKYNSLKKPSDKEKFQAQVAKSHKDMLQSLKAGYMMKAAYEEVKLDEAKPEFEVKYAKSKRAPIKVTKFMTLDQAKEFLADVKKDGMNGIISKGGNPVKEETILDRIDRKIKEKNNG